MKLDDIDSRLLAELQRDGRASYEELAHVVGLSRVATRARVERLLSSGAARVAGVVHPAVHGLAAFAHLGVHVTGPARAAADAIAEMPSAPFVSLAAGRYAVIAEVRGANVANVRDIAATVRGLPGVSGVETSLYAERIKDSHAPTLPVTAPELDDLDRRLLTALHANGRASFADLGRMVNLSPSATRTRVVDLITAKVVHVGAIIRPGLLGLSHMCGFALTCSGADTPLREIAGLDAVSYLATTLGRWHAIGTLQAPSADAAVATLDEIRALPGIRNLESWSHLAMVKEDYALTAPRAN
jgi:DNA-binding Lrp family transcriptional regulator